MMRGRTRLVGGLTTSAPLTCFSPPSTSLQPRAVAKALVKSPMQPVSRARELRTVRARSQRGLTDVYRDVILLRRRGESEGVPLPVGHLGTIAVGCKANVSPQIGRACVAPNST